MEWQPDWGLRARMLGTLCLAVVPYLLAGYLVVTYTSGAGTAVYALLFVGFAVVQYVALDAVIRQGLDVTDVSAEEYPRLRGTVDRLAQQADVPTPAVGLVDSAVPNALVVGRNRESATIVVTTGLLEVLESDELEAVLAHELAHVKNRDVFVMTVASFLSTMLSMVAVWGGAGTRATTGHRTGTGHRPGSNTIGATVIALLLAPLWVVSHLPVVLLSRYREFAADRGAVALTGSPGALASALQTVEEDLEATPETDMREAAELNAFFIVPVGVSPLPVDVGPLERVFATHPDLEDRLEYLRDLEGGR
ncbi:M48 family metalloprotease [Natrialbaceae archaeon A-gly3]